MNRRLLVLAAMLLSLAARTLSAQELATDAERSYRQLRKSHDTQTQLLAERWYGAIKLQVWTDATGKFSTTAKYLEHDPDFAWVKLRIIQGSGDERVVREVTIPVSKLSKVCQARVRRIGVLAEKVAAAVTEEEEQGSEVLDNGGEMSDDSSGGRNRSDAGLAGLDAEQVQAEGRDPRATSDPRQSRDPRQARDPRTYLPAEGASGSESAVAPAGGGSTLPALRAPVPSDRVAALPAVSPASDPRSSASAPAGPAEPAEPGAPPNLPDSDPWRTDYYVFRANFTVGADGTISVNEPWPGMVRMQELSVRAKHNYDQLVGRAARMTPTSFLEMPELGEVGEFMWEATVAQPVGAEAAWTEVLGLPPLPEPLKIEFRLDNERGAGPWQQLAVGDRVRFVGRLIGFAGHNVWVAAIRFPADQPASPAAPSRDPRRR